jgi:hypothetical protein
MTVEAVTHGDKEKILLIGFRVIDDEPATPSAVHKPENVNVTSSDYEGGLDVACDRDPQAKTYEAETTETPDVEASWAKHTGTTKSTIHLTGLPSGKRVFVRMRGIGPTGAGPWSDPISKMVP